MKYILCIHLIIPILLNSSVAFATEIKMSKDLDKDLVVGVFSMVPKGQFDKEISQPFSEFSSQCKKCKIENLTPYNEKNEIDYEKILNVLSQKNLENISILFFDFNLKKADRYLSLQRKIEDIASSGGVIVASAGEPMENEASVPLKKTIFGAVSQVIVIGELTERDRLLPTSYFGPEMYTAVRPPKDFIGKRKASLYFASKFLKDFSKHNSTEWILLLLDKKAKNKKLWVEWEDVFTK